MKPALSADATRLIFVGVPYRPGAMTAVFKRGGVNNFAPGAPAYCQLIRAMIEHRPTHSRCVLVFVAGDKPMEMGARANAPQLNAGLDPECIDWRAWLGPQRVLLADVAECERFLSAVRGS